MKMRFLIPDSESDEIVCEIPLRITEIQSPKSPEKLKKMQAQNDEHRPQSMGATHSSKILELGVKPSGLELIDLGTEQQADGRGQKVSIEKAVGSVLRDGDGSGAPTSSGRVRPPPPAPAPTAPRAVYRCLLEKMGGGLLTLTRIFPPPPPAHDRQSP